MNEFQKQHLGEFRIDEREVKLRERLEKYYRDTPDSMTNCHAKKHWQLFAQWAFENGYSREDINRAKCSLRQ